MQRELENLTKAGYIRCRRKANRLLYQANSDHIAYEPLRDFICCTVGPVGCIHKALKPFASKVIVAFIYGSVAAYNAHEESDLDLMVVGDVTYIELAKGLREVQGKLNREVNTAIFSPEEFASRYDENGSFIADIIAGQKMFVIGGEDELRALVHQWMAA